MGDRDKTESVVVYPGSEEAMKRSVTILHQLGLRDDQIVIVPPDDAARLHPDMDSRMLDWGRRGAAVGLFVGLLIAGPVVFSSEAGLVPDWLAVVLLAAIEGAVLGGALAAGGAGVATFAGWLRDRSGFAPTRSLPGAVIARGQHTTLIKVRRCLRRQGVRTRWCG